MQINKVIYNLINYNINGCLVLYKDCTEEKTKLKWSCFVKNVYQCKLYLINKVFKNAKEAQSANRKVLRDNIEGITKPAIRRLARLGGFIYEETHGESTI